MKKLTKVLVIAMMLLATVGVGVAVAGYNKADAAVRMYKLAQWKAACGQGYWKCGGFVVQGPYGPAKGDPEWAGTVIIFRRHNDASWQTCHVEVALNHDGSTHALTIDCFYGLDM